MRSSQWCCSVQTKSGLLMSEWLFQLAAPPVGELFSKLFVWTPSFFRSNSCLSPNANLVVTSKIGSAFPKNCAPNERWPHATTHWSAVSSGVRGSRIPRCDLNQLQFTGQPRSLEIESCGYWGDGPLANHNIVAQFRLSTKLCVHNAF
jgi:hypothetical protein